MLTTLRRRFSGYAGDHGSVESLHDALGRSSGMAAHVILWALGEIGDPSSGKVLIDALGAEELREAALKALVRLAPLDALDPILALLEELQGNEAIAGAMALRSIVLVQKEGIVEDAGVAARCSRKFNKPRRRCGRQPMYCFWRPLPSWEEKSIRRLPQKSLALTSAHDDHSGDLHCVNNCLRSS